ncbi:MAG: cadmium-translocating P-type ATPase [Candidatus Methanomethylophilaceae archaeon]|nr:cadmium-translocating P-type ATPase [Candidatus Methanomethylophilaceae archaeon]
MKPMNNFEKRLIIALAIFAVGMVLHFTEAIEEKYQFFFFLAAYLIGGYDVLVTAIRNIFKGQFLDEKFLMLIASVGAFVIGSWQEGAAVMLFFQVGEWFEDRAVNTTRQSIADLMDIQPEYANLVKDGEVVRVDPEEVNIGDMVEVLPGEKVPLDGSIVDGRSSLDTSALTGESVPRNVGPGDEVFSGSVNVSAKFRMCVTKEYEDSTVSKVLELVEDSISRKAPVEKFITKFARYYTPAVVGAAILVAVIPILLGMDPETWIYRALTFLVVSCPCAVVISVPLGYFCGIGAASKLGILVKGGNYLEALAHAETIVFDKTGTLTEGRFGIDTKEAVGCTEDELVLMAAMAESGSNHPIAISLKKECKEGFDYSRIGASEDRAGRGVITEIDGDKIAVGNRKLMAEVGAVPTTEDGIHTVVHVAKNGVYMGKITLSDIVKSTSVEAIKDLKANGIKRTVMLSGDAKPIGEEVANKIGLDEAHCELMPADKIEHLEQIIAEKAPKSNVVYVGDGINDAPSISRADIGVAMGGLGSDAAIEAADVVIMDDSPKKLSTAIKLARRTNSIVKQNIVFALGVKFLILALSLFGIANMWMAVFGDVGVAVVAILNSMRCLRTKMYEK